MNSVYAIIGGSGFNDFHELEDQEKESLDTPFGPCSSGLVRGNYKGKRVCFLPRHGMGHNVPPHMVPYRANMYRLKHLGVTHIISVNAVGGISSFTKPGNIVFPDQVIDYSYGRDHTFFDGSLLEDKNLNEIDFTKVHHIEFTEPFSKVFRQKMMDSALKIVGEDSIHLGSATYGCTQGPRLESAAEIKKLKNDGCDVVGMTLMPELALACELGMEFSAISVSVNWGAGLDEEIISMEEIYKILDQKIIDIKNICLQSL